MDGVGSLGVSASGYLPTLFGKVTFLWRQVFCAPEIFLEISDPFSNQLKRYFANQMYLSRRPKAIL